jgi:RNA polymerase sigma factor (sigma-70 family)
MRTGWSRSLTRDVGRLGGAGTLAGLTEGEVLDEFARHRDELAFESLMLRHGPMVLGVCRRWLRDPNDVDDAFQATFLVLARRARSIRPGAALGPWLHGVARRVAARARSEAARRPQHVPGGNPEPVDPRPSPAPELRWALDDELGHLPEKYRAPLVLCYLEGRTHEEAAAALRWPVGTVRGRLSRGRDALRDRLTRRGIVPDAAIGTALTIEPAEVARILSASSPVPAALIESTRHAALGAAAGQLAGRLTLSARVVALAEGATRAMTLFPLKAAAGLLSVGLVAAGATTLAAKGYGPGFGSTSEPGPHPIIRPAIPGGAIGFDMKLINTSTSQMLAANPPPPAILDPSPSPPEAHAPSPFDLDQPGTPAALPAEPTLPSPGAPPIAGDVPPPDSNLTLPDVVQGEIPVQDPVPPQPALAEVPARPSLPPSAEPQLAIPAESAMPPPIPGDPVPSPRRPGESVAKYLARVRGEVEAMVKELTAERETTKARLDQIDQELEQLAGFQKVPGIGPRNVGVGRIRRSAPTEDDHVTTRNRSPNRVDANIGLKVSSKHKVLDVGEETTFSILLIDQGPKDALFDIGVEAEVSDNLKIISAAISDEPGAMSAVLTFVRDPLNRNDQTIVHFPRVENLHASTANRPMVIRVKAVRPGRAICRVVVTHPNLQGDAVEGSAAINVIDNDPANEKTAIEREPTGDLEPATTRPSPTPEPTASPAAAPIESTPAVPSASEVRPAEISPIDPPSAQPAVGPTPM